MTRQRPEVVVVYKTLPHYRVAFFEALRDRLDEEGANFRLLIGQPDQMTSERRDTGAIRWAESFDSRFFYPGGRQLVWQPVLRSLRKADLVIVEQASRLLVNYVLVLWRRFGGPKLAWWGHGGNLDVDSASRLSEALKRRIANKADWWFCYTDGTAQRVQALGVDRNQMTVVQNTTDTEALSEAHAATTCVDIAAKRAELGIGNGPVAISIGSIYPTKRPGFLIEAADHLRSLILGFELLVVGDGPDRSILDDASSTRPWLHVVGVKVHSELAHYAGLASVLLNPGLVGLTVVDGFALGLPMVTCDLPSHGPEIEYLEDGVNGVMLPSGTTPLNYAESVAALLADESRLKQLSDGALSAASRYTMEEMVNRFTQGVLHALQTEPSRG